MFISYEEMYTGKGYVSVNQHMSRYGKFKTQDKEFFL